MKKTGGTFDPSKRGIIFLASVPATIDISSRAHSDKLVAVNELQSNRGTARSGNTAHDIVESWLNAGHRVFLDSGIFNLTNEHMRAHGTTMDEALALAPDLIDGFDDLLRRYVEAVRLYGDRSWGYIELDQGGRENKIKTRAKLEEMGLRPIPVYHPINDGWDYFDELAKGYDRICIGNLVQASPAVRRRIMATISSRKRAYPELWIHALGVSPTPNLLSFPFDSADASTWLHGVRWGAWHPKADMKTCGAMDQSFLYNVGEKTEAFKFNGDWSHSVLALGHEYHFISEGWRHHMARLAEEGLA